MSSEAMKVTSANGPGRLADKLTRDAAKQESRRRGYEREAPPGPAAPRANDPASDRNGSPRNSGGEDEHHIQDVEAVDDVQNTIEDGAACHPAQVTSRAP